MAERATTPADNMTLVISERLSASCRETPERSRWLKRLPHSVRELQTRWSLKMGLPFDSAETSCTWVAPVTLANGTPAVLKLGIPHFEGEHEIAGLRCWNGDPTVQLLDADEDLGAMLLERCEPGTFLRALPESEQDVVVAQLLRRMWAAPAARPPFRPLLALTQYWSAEAVAHQAEWPDAGLTCEALSLFAELPQTAPCSVLLATDLHAGNVLSAQREPWLVIDPKPFVGDPAFDATQHLLNCPERLRLGAIGTIRRFANPSTLILNVFGSGHLLESPVDHTTIGVRIGCSTWRGASRRSQGADTRCESDPKRPPTSQGSGPSISRRSGPVRRPISSMLFAGREPAHFADCERRRCHRRTHSVLSRDVGRPSRGSDHGARADGRHAGPPTTGDRLSAGPRWPRRVQTDRRERRGRRRPRDVLSAVRVRARVAIRTQLSVRGAR
jgi:streptomycin 6-kinase